MKKASGRGLRISVQGVADVGSQLPHKAGADFIATNVNVDLSQDTAERYGAAIVGLEKIYGEDVHVFSLCVGAVLNDETTLQLRTSIIVGVGNNLLTEPRHGTILHELNILYAPAYDVNDGRMLTAAGDIFGRSDAEKVTQRTLNIYNTTPANFATSAARNQPTSATAAALARAKIRAGKSSS